jgi:hypothetical protein
MNPINPGGLQSAADWRSRRVACFYGQLDSRIEDAQKRDYDTISLGDIFSMKPTSVQKSQALAFIPSSYFAFDARAHVVQQQQGRFVALTLDVDKGNRLVTEIESAVRVFFGDITTFLVYSSSSACDSDKKWRAIVPLQEPMEFDEWSLWQRAFFETVEMHLGCKVDHSLGRAGQPVFLPNVPPERRDEQGEPLFFVKHVYSGSPLGKGGPYALSRVEAILQGDAEDASKAQEARLEALERLQRRAALPNFKGSVIEAYNASHSIDELLLANGYCQGGRDNWRSPYQSSSTFATKNFGNHWVSLSESDAHAGVGAEFASGRFGDAFDLFCHFDHGGDVKAAVKACVKVDAGEQSTGSGLSNSELVTKDLMGAIKTHPLANYVEAEPETFTQDEFVLDGAVVAGMVLLAGAWGAGKTTQLVPLMCRAAHLCKKNDTLRPLLRRRVVYVAEDVGQVRRILRSMRHAGEFEGISKAEVADFFKVVPATRLKPQEIVRVAAELAKLATVNHNSINKVKYSAQAVVVFDTRSAVIALDDENNNAEASEAIATFRQGMPNNPLIVVGHLAKAIKRADVKELSGRGAGAWEADVQQVLYLVNDNGVRWLDVATPKHRFVAEVDGIEFATYKASVAGQNQLGDLVDIPLMHGLPKLVSLGGRKKDLAQQIALREDKENAALRRQVFTLFEHAGNIGKPPNRDALKKACKGYRTEKVVEMIEQLVGEQWLLEVEVPKSQRIHPKKSHFLVILNDYERRELMQKGVVPTDKVIVPPSWRKPENSSVPAALSGAQEASAGGV